jgi:predicted enzyme related to lactoylglutathione lyase
MTAMHGRFVWYELMTTDIEAVDIGEMGTYQLFATGDRSIGGMFNKPAAVPVPFRQYYFCVGAIEEAAARVTSAGGRIINGPMQVPGGALIVQCTDPQGATFASLGSGPAAA